MLNRPFSANCINTLNEQNVVSGAEIINGQNVWIERQANKKNIETFSTCIKGTIQKNVCPNPFNHFHQQRPVGPDGVCFTFCSPGCGQPEPFRKPYNCTTNTFKAATLGPCADLPPRSMSFFDQPCSCPPFVPKSLSTPSAPTPPPPPPPPPPSPSTPPCPPCFTSRLQEPLFRPYSQPCPSAGRPYRLKLHIDNQSQTESCGQCQGLRRDITSMIEMLVRCNNSCTCPTCCLNTPKDNIKKLVLKPKAPVEKPWKTKSITDELLENDTCICPDTVPKRRDMGSSTDDNNKCLEDKCCQSIQKIESSTQTDIVTDKPSCSQSCGCNTNDNGGGTKHEDVENKDAPQNSTSDLSSPDDQPPKDFKECKCSDDEKPFRRGCF